MIYLKTATCGIFGDKVERPIHARFDRDNIPANCPPLAPGVEIVRDISPGDVYYEGFLISGYDWHKFFTA